jgi:DUF1680 family protein
LIRSRPVDDFEAEDRDDLPGGSNVLRGTTSVVDDSGWESQLYRPTEPSSKVMRITVVPDYAWDNRVLDAIRVWLHALL